MRSARATCLAAIGILLWASVAGATLTPPPGFGPDDGSTAFLPAVDNVFQVEILDFFGSFLDTSFGFFFLNDPTSPVAVFAPDDGPSPQVALIDFANGIVFDVDAGVPQSTFAGTGAIGFFLSIIAPSGPLTFFSTPALNPGGIDVVATFPSLTNPLAYLIGFEHPVEAGTAIGFEFTVGLQPVPEPAIYPTALVALGLLLSMRRRTRRGGTA